jgi:hypothetical protein
MSTKRKVDFIHVKAIAIIGCDNAATAQFSAAGRCRKQL